MDGIIKRLGDTEGYCLRKALFKSVPTKESAKHLKYALKIQQYG